jgi:multidrug efflux pump subunit AcrB
VPEVQDYQAYAGTSAPISFNGLVRQYYLRQGSEQGDIQVNLVDKHHRKEQSHAIAMRVRPALEAIVKPYGASLKVVEVPPGLPVMAPLVAEIYGPDDEGRRQAAAQVRKVFEQTSGIVDTDSSAQADSPRWWLRVDRSKQRRPVSASRKSCKC